MIEACKQINYQNRIIVVRLASQKGINKMTPETKKQLEQLNVTVVTAGHALSGAERGLSGRFNGVYPVEIMAHTLRTFGQGTKVCFECAVMALDNDAVIYNQPVVAIGGSSRGSDTPMIITPSYSATILDTKIHEILVKPDLY